MDAGFPPEERTVVKVLTRQAEAFGDKELVVSADGESVTYRELDEVSNRIAHGVEALGIEHQEPVLAMLPDVIACPKR